MKDRRRWLGRAAAKPNVRRGVVVAGAVGLVVAALSSPAEAAGMPPKPPLCPVGVVTTNPNAPTADAGCLVDTGWSGAGSGLTRATAMISISAPQVITIGRPFTFTIHAGVGVCTGHTVAICVSQWFAELRDPGATTIAPLSLRPAHPAASRACEGTELDDASAKAVKFNVHLHCLAVVVDAAPSYKLSATWYALGGDISMAGGAVSGAYAELELPVEIVLPPHAK